MCIPRSHCSNFLFLTCTSVCIFWNQGPRPQHGRIYPSVLRCVLCVCDLWPLLVEHSVVVACISKAGVWGGIAGQNGCFLRGVHCSVHKKKISNWNFRFNCPLCCLQLTVMLQMKPVEKSHFSLHVYWIRWKISSDHFFKNVYWCALHSWHDVVISLYSCGYLDKCRCCHFLSRNFQQLLDYRKCFIKLKCYH